MSSGDEPSQVPSWIRKAAQETWEELIVRQAKRIAELEAEVKMLRVMYKSSCNRAEKAEAQVATSKDLLDEARNERESLYQIVDRKTHEAEHLASLNEGKNTSIDALKARAEKAEAEVERMNQFHHLYCHPDCDCEGGGRDLPLRYGPPNVNEKKDV